MFCLTLTLTLPTNTALSAQVAPESANLNQILRFLFVPRKLETYSYVGLPKLNQSLTRQCLECRNVNCLYMQIEKKSELGPKPPNCFQKPQVPPLFQAIPKIWGAIQALDNFRGLSLPKPLTNFTYGYFSSKNNKLALYLCSN